MNNPRWFILIPITLLTVWFIHHQRKPQPLRDHGNWTVSLPDKNGIVKEMYVLKGHACASVESERTITWDGDRTNWNIFELSSDINVLEYACSTHSREDAEKQVESDKCDYDTYMKKIMPFYGNTWTPDDTKKHGTAAATGNCAVANSGNGNTVKTNCK